MLPTRDARCKAFLSVARIANGGIKARLFSPRSLRQGFCTNGCAKPGCLTPPEPEGRLTGKARSSPSHLHPTMRADLQENPEEEQEKGHSTSINNIPHWVPGISAALAFGKVARWDPRCLGNLSPSSPLQAENHRSIKS